MLKVLKKNYTFKSRKKYFDKMYHELFLLIKLAQHEDISEFLNAYITPKQIQSFLPGSAVRTNNTKCTVKFFKSYFLEIKVKILKK